MRRRRSATSGATAPLRPSQAFAAAAASRPRETGTRPFSIRLSETERQHLEQAAGSVPVGTYIRARLLDEKPRRAAKRPVSDTVALGRLLGEIGRSNIASGLADLAAAARLGTVVVTPDLEKEIGRACASLQDIRNLLLRALGLSERATP